jgi:hypothetical protein
MTEADHLQGFPKIHKERKTDGQGRKSQGRIRQKATQDTLSTYLGKSCRQVPPPPLWAFFPQWASAPIEVFRTLFVIYLFPELAVLACISIPSCQNPLKEIAACELRNVSQNLGLVWGLEEPYRKLKRFLGQCLLWVFPLLLLTFSIFFFFYPSS